MPDYPAARDSYHNIVNLRVPTYLEAITHVGNPNAFFDGGFTRLAKAPIGKSWLIESIWLSNWHTTDSFKMTLTRVPFDWTIPHGTAGSVDDDNLFILRGLTLGPGQYLTVPTTFSLAHGDELWGYQIEASGGTTFGVTMIVGVRESYR